MAEKKKSPAKKAWTRVKKDNERGARESLIEELFYDFNRNRHQVYLMNFIRGIFFGLGSVIGGTIVIALIIWIFSLLGGVFPALDTLFENISRLLESKE